mgnify:FL=1
MFNKLKGKLYPSLEVLLQDILDGNFDESSALTMIESNSINLNLQNNDGDTIVHECLKNKKYKEAIWFINQNIDVNIENNEGITLARLAVAQGNIDVLKALIDTNKIDVDKLDNNKRSLLQDSIINGNRDITNLLMKFTKNINSTDKNNRNAVFDAISYGDNETTYKIIENDDINLNVIDNEGNTVLHKQEVIDNQELAIRLLKNGADPTICDREGTNFLTKIALLGETGEAMLKVAIRMGCNINAKTSDDNTILMEVMYAFSKISSSELVRRSQFKNMAQKLIKHGINVKAVNNKQETVLFDLVRASDIEGCAFVVENGVELNQINYNGETALSLAILKGVENLDIIILLLQYGADASIKNKYHQTVPEILNNIILHIHSHKKLLNPDILNAINPAGNYMVILKEILGGSRCDFDYLDSEGNPLYLTPFLFNNLPLCKLYFNIGVDINIKNKEGYTLFYLYILSQFKKGKYSKEFRPTLNFLLANGANILTRNKNHQTIFSVISQIQNCNLALFRQLIEITRYDYTVQDNRGRTIMHSCVWGNNLKLIEIIYGVERNIQNIPDNYGILPITYAALLGNTEIVTEFLNRGSNIKSGKIPKLIINNFHPMLKNLDQLIDEYTPKDHIKKFEILIDTIKKDFNPIS